ncbi:hypothetical protein FRB98_000610 [Tulasnella sp. 332]|nr:hypothetical protein FRB98_000610 [Tulasnella sp. 332]
MVHRNGAREEGMVFTHGWIVGVPYFPPRLLPSSPFEGDNISLMLLAAGWGATYTEVQAGYGSEGQGKHPAVGREARFEREALDKGQQESPRAPNGLQEGNDKKTHLRSSWNFVKIEHEEDIRLIGNFQEEVKTYHGFEEGMSLIHVKAGG